MSLCEALAIARKRGRAFQRCSWMRTRRVVVAWGGMWQRQRSNDDWNWLGQPMPWTPTFDELLANDWVTVRP